MLVTIICGVSGVGKTYARTRSDSPWWGLPYIDMADIYRELETDETGLVVADYHTAMDILIRRIGAARRGEVPRLVVEGYFLPGSDSRRWLDGALRAQGIRVEYVLLHAPLQVCSDRLLAQWDALSDEEQADPVQFNSFKKRRELLLCCWKPALAGKE